MSTYSPPSSPGFQAYLRRWIYMYHADTYRDARMTSSLGHVAPHSGATTVNPVELRLTQPSHGPSQSYRVYAVSPGYNFGGYPQVVNTPQGISRHPLTRVTRPMGHTLAEFSVANNVPPERFTGLASPFGRMPRRSRTCQWVMEDSSSCEKTISRENVTGHLAEHGIRCMSRDLIVQCCWRGCGTSVKRQNIARHVREVHLGLKRRSHSAAGGF